MIEQVLIVIAIVCLSVLFARKIDDIRGVKKAPKEDVLHTDVKQMKRVADKALSTLNCEPSWEKDKENWIARYDYQGGHFRLRLSEQSPFASLSYLFFYSAENESLELVRNVCNQCNMNSDSSRIFYSVNNEQNTVDVHISDGVLLKDDVAASIIKNSMTEAFLWQNAFVKRFNELKSSNDEDSNRDIEKTSSTWSREVFLLNEQEMTHEKARELCYDDQYLLLGLEELLSRLLSLKEIKFQRVVMTEINGEKTSSKELEIGDEELELPTLIIKDGAFVNDRVTLSIDLTCASMPKQRREVTVDLTRQEATNDALYFRATFTLVPVSPSKNAPMGTSATTVTSQSVLLAYDLTTPKQRIDEFNYMWKEAHDKYKKGEFDEMTPEQRLICNETTFSLSYDLYRGGVLFRDKRFYEAVFHFENAYNALKWRFDSMDAQTREKFFDICYRLGFGYCELLQYAKAYFYLELTLPLHRVVYTEEYINCLVNSHDFRALNIIDNLLEEIVANEDEDEQPEPHIQSFVSFLKRRKAYVLIDQEKLDEAETLLKPMLDDAENSDFAISELAYIQKIRERRNDIKEEK